MQTKTTLGGRKFDVVGDKVYHSYRIGQPQTNGVYVKLPHEGSGGYGDVKQEYESYHKINSYLRMPLIRKIRDVDGVEILIIQKLAGEMIGDLLLRNPENASLCLERYAYDLQKMWRATVKPIKESMLAVNQRSGYTKRLESFFYFRETERFLTTPTIINGTQYKHPGEMLEKVLQSLRSRTDSVMTLGHGDDHLANILTDVTGDSLNYYIIDPKLAGFYPPAISYLNTAMYLLMYKYTYAIKEVIDGNKIQLDYSVMNKPAHSSYGIIDVLQIMEHGLLELNGGFGMFREYAIANLLRFVQHLNDPKNFHHTKPNQLGYLALAIELASNKYHTISEVYASIR